MTKMMRNYVIGLSIAIVIYAAAVSWLTIRDIIAPVELIDTMILFILASATIFYAIRTSDIAKATEKQADASVKMAEEMRKQLKLNTFLTLLVELAEKQARENRRLIFQHLPSSTQITNIQEGILRDESSVKRYRDAVEETISNLDRVGFFLIKGDPQLKDDAPEWIWTITSQMWARTEWYVRHRKEGSRGYGKYFEELHNEAERRGFKEQLQNEKRSEDKEVS